MILLNAYGTCRSFDQILCKKSKKLPDYDTKWAPPKMHIRFWDVPNLHALCNLGGYALCLYNFPLTNFVNAKLHAFWEVMHYESDAKREGRLYLVTRHAAAFTIDSRVWNVYFGFCINQPLSIKLLFMLRNFDGQIFRRNHRAKSQAFLNIFVTLDPKSWVLW